MTKSELIELMDEFDDDAQIDIYVQDHYRGFDSAELVHVRHCPFSRGNERLRLICDLNMGIKNDGEKGHAKITFRK